jgi:hypothetical protein
LQRCLPSHDSLLPSAYEYGDANRGLKYTAISRTILSDESGRRLSAARSQVMRRTRAWGSREGSRFEGGAVMACRRKSASRDLYHHKFENVRWCCR